MSTGALHRAGLSKKRSHSRFNDVASVAGRPSVAALTMVRRVHHSASL